MKKYSLECAPTYTTQENTSNKALLRRLGEIIGWLEGTSWSLVLLVDDVTTGADADYDSTSYGSYANWLEDNGYKPDLIFRESQILLMCDGLISSLNFRSLSPELAIALRTGQHHPSPLFIATWCLMRLGYITFTEFPQALQADSLINILPASWKPGEDQALEIIKATPYAEAAEKIEYQFV